MKAIKDTNEEYHSKDSISASGLKTIYKKSVKHFLEQKPFSSKSMELGTAVHTIMLEGSDVFYNDYYLLPKLDLRYKADKEQLKQHEKLAKGRKLLKEDEMYIIDKIMVNYRSNDLAQESCTGDVEVSHYGQFNGIDVRVRPDVIGTDFIGDVKTCQDNSPQAFRRDIYKYNYHLQACFYSDVLGYDPAKFRFIAVETNHPFSVQVYKLKDETIEKGREAYNKALNLWKLYKETGIVSGYVSDDQMEDGTILI